MPNAVMVTVDGRPVEVPAGATALAAVLLSGLPRTRTSVKGEPRGPLCGMGICFECRLAIDGQPHQRSCMIPCREGMEIGTGDISHPQPPPSKTTALRDGAQCDVLVIGAGPAGLSAANAAAGSGAETILLDEGPWPGGQIWRSKRGHLNTKTQELVNLSTQLNVRVVPSASVFDLSSDGLAEASTPSGVLSVRFKNVILATGARENFLPFPGWTLPNVMGAGALQALVKSGLEVSGARVLVAGTGPLLLEVARFLKSQGANVKMILEQAPAVKLARFGLGLVGHGSKLRQAFGLVPIAPKLKPGHWVRRAIGAEQLESVEITNGRNSRTVQCDYLACGYGLGPNIELALLMGCRIEDGFVSVNDSQCTSVPNVYCAGEPTGIGGLDMAVIEGQIAGYTAAGSSSKAAALAKQRRHEQGFTKLYQDCFALREELRSMATPETVVCRCEDVTIERLNSCSSAREAKIYTRFGMGPCQGRICGGATRFLFGWDQPTVRPPVTPVPVAHLMECGGHKSQL